MTATRTDFIPGNAGTSFQAEILTCCISTLSSWVYTDAAYPCWIFYWDPEPGAFLICGDGRKIELTPEKSVLIPPYTKFSTGNRSPFRQFYVHFSLPAPFDRVERKILTGSARHARLFMNRLSSVKIPGTEPLLLRLMLYASLIRIPAESFLEPGDMPLSPGIRRITAYMDEHFMESIDNRMLAKKAGMGLNLFYRTFSRELGMSPGHYLLNRRMDQARKLLLAGESSIDEIAEQTGYADRFHFSKKFKKFYTVPPGLFRKKSCERFVMTAKTPVSSGF